MNSSVSYNTQAILLLTAPLITGRGGHSSELLTLGEYNRLAKTLHDNQREPADLLGPEAVDLLKNFQDIVDRERLTRLLERGFLLTQALDKWQTRSIWVVSRADHEYPTRMKSRLREYAPPVLYSCGNLTILNTGGLAIVGSRKVDETLVGYTESVGRLAAQSSHTVISGCARGIDQSAMSSALQAGGRVIGVLADNLNRLVLSRDLREYLMDDQLVLISPYDPSAGFNVGHAMQRNKIIYALADAALIVSSDYRKGGTWTGAIEQLEKFHFVPVYVRSNGDPEKSLKALQNKGALAWPNPQSPDLFIEALNVQIDLIRDVRYKEVASSKDDRNIGTYETKSDYSEPMSVEMPNSMTQSSKPADELFAKVKELLSRMKDPKTETEVAVELQVSKKQAREWLQRLVKEGMLRRKQKPLRYFVSSEKQENLFKISDQ
jgi:DNA processing protein